MVEDRKLWDKQSGAIQRSHKIQILKLVMVHFYGGKHGRRKNPNLTSGRR